MKFLVRQVGVPNFKFRISERHLLTVRQDDIHTLYVEQIKESDTFSILQTHHIPIAHFHFAKGHRPQIDMIILFIHRHPELRELFIHNEVFIQDRKLCGKISKTVLELIIIMLYDHKQSLNLYIKHVDYTCDQLKELNEQNVQLMTYSIAECYCPMKCSRINNV